MSRKINKELIKYIEKKFFQFMIPLIKDTI